MYENAIWVNINLGSCVMWIALKAINLGIGHKLLIVLTYGVCHLYHVTWASQRGRQLYDWYFRPNSSSFSTKESLRLKLACWVLQLQEIFQTHFHVIKMGTRLSLGLSRTQRLAFMLIDALAVMTRFDDATIEHMLFWGTVSDKFQIDKYRVPECRV